MPETLDGIIGTGGGVFPPCPPNIELNPAVERRCVDAMVLKPSRMLPFDERVLRRCDCECKVFMSGMDFLTRKAAWFEACAAA